MKKSFRVLVCFLIVFAMTATVVCSAFAQNQGNAKQGKFKDITEDFWAYQAIMNLVDLGIINGYTDNTFRPNASVTRSEFATMLTKALKLTPADNSQTFADVPPTSWDFKAVEAAKKYLTGYLTSGGALYFYGSRNAVREDMAVALVKALSLTVESNNGRLQQVFSDYAAISPKLVDHVYTAYKNGIMIGSNGRFGPQNNLTRAEAATLLLRALQKTEKVPVDGGQKVPVDGSVPTPYDTDATLSSLAYDGTSVPGFSAGRTAYNVVLPAGTRTIPVVSAVVHDTGKALAYITQAAALPGMAVVLVLAQDGVTQKVYTVNFTAAAAPSTDARLERLQYNGVDVAGFSAGTTAYFVTLPAGTTAVPAVTAIAHDMGKAAVYIAQAQALPGVASVVVTAQDGTTRKVYTISFSVSGP